MRKSYAKPPSVMVTAFGIQREAKVVTRFTQHSSLDRDVEDRKASLPFQVLAAVI